MKSKIVVILITIIIVAIFLIQKQGANKLVSPGFNQVNKQTNIDAPNATPNAPKSYNFDSSTDLKKELFNINPQVLDSDFQ